MLLRIATRKSPLALKQAEWVAHALQTLHPGLRIELIKLETQGDVQLSGPLYESGGKGLFVKEIQEALLAGKADLAVHSAKDYPQLNPPALAIAAIPAREDRRDLLLTPGGVALDTLPAGARVGGSSLRRQGQLLALRPDLKFVNLRGNVGSRLKKLAAGDYDAIILAAAGLIRLGEKEWLTKGAPLPIVPSAGQGALLIEARADDQPSLDLATLLNNPAAHAEVTAERAFVAALGGDCATPIGASALAHDGKLNFTGLLVAGDGSRLVRAEAGPAEQSEAPAILGRLIAEKLLQLPGAMELLKNAVG